MAVLRATQPFAYTDHTGVPRVVRVGDLFDESDPCVAKRLSLFEPVETAATRVESATASPGERRTRTRAKKQESPDVDSPAAFE